MDDENNFARGRFYGGRAGGGRRGQNLNRANGGGRGAGPAHNGRGGGGGDRGGQHFNERRAQPGNRGQNLFAGGHRGAAAAENPGRGGYGPQRGGARGNRGSATNPARGGHAQNATGRQGFGQSGNLRNAVDELHRNNGQSMPRGGGPGGRNAVEGKGNVALPLGYEKLNHLASESIPDLELMQGITSGGGFYAAMNVDTPPHPERLGKILTVLARASQVNEGHFRYMLHDLLSNVLSSKFFDWIQMDVTKLQLNLAPPKLDKERFMLDVCVLLVEILDKVREHDAKIMTLVTTVFATFEKKDGPFAHVNFDDEVENEADDVTSRLRQIRRRLKLLFEDVIQKYRKDAEEGKKPARTRPDMPELEPLDDFRQLPVFPRTEEILTFEKPRLRKNVIDGAYQDVDHYLDINFRLLREDFIWPIREAIQSLTDTGPNAISKHMVKIYRDAKFAPPEIDKRTALMVYTVQFNMKPFQRINWETSKRLLHGSLICFTVNEFQTVFFATVFERVPADLRKGQIKVTVDQFPLDGIQYGRQYSFVESPAFFEAYKHVLRALQQIRGRDMPFLQQLVHCDPNVPSPRYIREDPRLNFKCLAIENVQKNAEVGGLERNPARGGTLEVRNVLNLTTWPSMEAIGVDKNQYEALQQAVTRGLAIIQGPPGTGKTYVGLKIVRLLLDKLDKVSPLLVVCYTNHALDQFLEGIAKTLPNEGLGEVVRIGGGQKIKEEVMKYHLRTFLEQHNNADRQMLYQIREKKIQRKRVEESMNAAKKMLKNPNQTLMSPEQILRIGGEQLEYPLFFGSSANAMEVILRRWLSIDPNAIQGTPGDIDAEIWRNLVLITGADDQFCMIALMDTVAHKGNMDQWITAAVVWQNAVTNFMNNGFSFEEIRFAMQLHRNNIEATTNYLVSGNAAPVAQPPEMNPVPEPAAAEEAEDLANGEMLEPERDFDDAAFNFDDNDLAMGTNNFDDEWTLKGNQRLGLLPDFILRRIAVAVPLSDREANAASEHPWQMHLQQRWRLYKYWQRRHMTLVEGQLRGFEEEYQRRTEDLRELEDLGLVNKLRKARVIAMTTTGAAKKQAVLHQLRPKVVVVEEAAEVLEAHIVTSLSPQCEHLILIGDHKQLRPNPSVYELAQHYNLDVSLFERLVKNNFKYATLREQHRMRPEIADTLMPEFYDELRNHPSVYNREDIKGVTKNIFFINHNQMESDDSDSKSHSNIHEAQFLVALCQYLIQQGYEPEKITILACYLAQMACIRKLLAKTLISKVRITVVDNFQGEENDIILLSMVRSNTYNKIGFLSTPNRICVALSRAKFGFYVSGNFDHLAAHSGLWQNLVGRLRTNGFVGDKLQIACQIHGTVSEVQNGDDFKMYAPAGGCRELCNLRMPCGHVCNRKCHPTDPQHLEFKCRRPCEKMCGADLHKCPKLCSDDCDDCKVLTRKTLGCGHDILALCHLPLARVKCTESCEKVLICGHVCRNKCGEPCSIGKCTEKVAKRLMCGHTKMVECFKDVRTDKIYCDKEVMKKWPFCGHEMSVACSTQIDVLSCPHPCNGLLNCEHVCRGKCGECRRGRLHVRCQEECKRILICGHECQENCSKACPPCTRPCENKCVHSMCGKVTQGGGKNKKKLTGLTCGQPCALCSEKCAWKCEHFQCDLLCYKPCERPRCTKKCEKKLKCQHDCVGVCGEPCPKICKICDREKYEELLEMALVPVDDDKRDEARFVQLEDCEHVVEVTGLDQWFDTKIREWQESNDAQEIQLLRCPFCNKPVRTNQRYGAVAKQQMLDVQQVKTHQHGSLEELKTQREDLMKIFETLEDNVPGELKKLFCALKELVARPNEHDLDKNRLANLRTYVLFLSQMVNFWKVDFVHLRDIPGTIPDNDASANKERPKYFGFLNLFTTTPSAENSALPAVSSFFEHWFAYRLPAAAGFTTGDYAKALVNIVKNEMTFLSEWMLQNAKKSSQQMVDEFGCEWQRLFLLTNLFSAILMATKRSIDVQTSEFRPHITEIMNILYGGTPIDAKLEARVKVVMKNLQRLSDGLAISDQERIQIIKAMGMRQGHWYKCKNGHVYCITECGGAMQEASCPECGEKIGGGSHRLRGDNAVATEMDGSTVGAYEGAVARDHQLARRLQAGLRLQDDFDLQDDF